MPHLDRFLMSDLAIIEVVNDATMRRRRRAADDVVKKGKYEWKMMST